MSIILFQSNLKLLSRFIMKLNTENIPKDAQRIMIRHYGNHLRMNLTVKMVDDLLLG